MLFFGYLPAGDRPARRGDRSRSVRVSQSDAVQLDEQLALCMWMQCARKEGKGTRNRHKRQHH